jgi:rSAM/selenodomain-associated transferase 1
MSVGTARVKAVHHILNPALPDPGARGLCALAIMTKAPRAGYVKTRLVPPLTADEAAALNVCLLRDTAAAIAQALGENARGVAIYTPIGAEAEYIDILPSGFELVPQRDGAFGERLALAAQDLFRIGFSSVCLIDSDSPTVAPEIYAQAASELMKAGDRAVLGPSDDGGYYLIGLKQNHRSLFEHIDWSTERVLDQTIQRAAEHNLEVKLLAVGFDVDDRATLRRLCDELLGQNSNASVAPETRRFLRNLIEREGRQRVWPVQVTK